MLEIKPKAYDSAWCLTEEGRDPRLSKYYEGLFTQGNGYMDVRASFEEGLASVQQDREYERKPANVTLEAHVEEESNWGTYIPGVVGRHPYLMTEMINLPYFFDLQLEWEGERLDMNDACIRNYRRYLDLRDGTLHREFIWETAAGAVLELSYLRFLSMDAKHLAVDQVKVRVIEGDGSLAVSGGIHAGVRTNGFNHLTEIDFAAVDERTCQVAVTTNGNNRVVMQSRLFCNTLLPVENGHDARRGYVTGSLTLCAGEELLLQKQVAVATDRDLEIQDPDVICQQTLTLAEECGAMELYERHCTRWQAKWDQSDVRITGDDRTQKALRMSLYHLIRSNNEEDARVAICAKGYAGAAYFGRYFWDTEISLLPYFIYSNPAAAKNLLLFRYHTLEGAKRNAKVYGYEGARYPWESSVTGDEECANWQYADHEIHVTADIVYAMMHYVKATKDTDFVRDYGIDILVETARYWCTRVDRFPDGSYQLLGVMGPDEYLPITSNNRYTNYMVRYALQQTLYWLQRYRPKHLEVTEEEIARFTDVAEHLRVELGDGIIWQCDEFPHYADIDFDTVWKDRNKCFGTFISQERNYRSKALKQADLLELMMLFPQEFTMEQLQTNYDYYEPITTHDSSLSAAVHGILTARMNRMEEACDFLNRVIGIDMDPMKRGAEEGIHIANCGGLWQLVVLGFAGMKSAMESDDVIFEPHLPSGWERIELPVMRHGLRERYEILASEDGPIIKKLS
ncbi:MAG: glycoside hydrolase family 65 protein [Lachnospiraceae bacterium]|nr:glycoside hydrolase family 65 protein [Lachnospiraceae bacterium]